MHISFFLLVIKRKNELKLMVALELQEFDLDKAVSSKGGSSSLSADTNSPVFIGGIPDGMFLLKHPSSCCW